MRLLDRLTTLRSDYSPQRITLVLLIAWLLASCSPLGAVSSGGATVTPAPPTSAPTSSPTASSTATDAPTPSPIPPTATPEPTPTKEVEARIEARIGKVDVPEKERTYKLITADAPDHPDYPLIRDEAGKPLLGVIAVDPVSDAWNGGLWSVENMRMALVVGRIAGVEQAFEGAYEVIVDVPTTDPQQYLRFSTGLYVQPQCRGRGYPPLYDLSDTIERVRSTGQPFPAEFDLNSLPLQVAHYETFCQLMQNFLNSNPVGAPIGFNFTDPAPIMIEGDRSFTDAASVFDQLVDGKVPPSNGEYQLHSYYLYLPEQFFTADFKPVDIP